MPRKKRKNILIILTILIFTILLGIFLYLYFNTDILKSNQKLFIKYLEQMTENIKLGLKEENIEKINSSIQNNRLKTETIAQVKYQEITNIDFPINKLQIKIDGNMDKYTNYNYKNINVMQDDEIVAGMKCLTDGEKSSVKINGIKQYLTTENNEENKVSKLNEIINLNIEDLIKLSQDEIEIIKNKYEQIFIDNIENAKYSKRSNVDLLIDGKTYKTNTYTISLSKEKFNNLYIKILENLKKDETILGKIEKIDEQINTYYMLTNNEKKSDIKQELTDKIEKKITQIQNTNIGNENRTITVYETEGKAISIAIDIEEKEIRLDCVKLDKRNFINLTGKEKNKEKESNNSESNNQNNNEEEKIFDIKIDKINIENSEQVRIVYSILKDGNKIVNELKREISMENSNVKLNVEFIKDIDNRQIFLFLDKNMEIVNDFEKEKLDQNNNIVWEKLTENQKTSAQNTLNKKGNLQMEKIYARVSKEDIKNMLTKMKILPEEVEEIENTGITEAERNRFNANYELFEGNDIDKTKILELIEVAKNDLKKIKIIKYKENNSTSEEKIPSEIKFEISRNNNNIELANKFKKYIEESKDEKFSIKLEYDENTGLISDIYIIIKDK